MRGDIQVHPINFESDKVTRQRLKVAADSKADGALVAFKINERRDHRRARGAITSEANPGIGLAVVIGMPTAILKLSGNRNQYVLGAWNLPAVIQSLRCSIRQDGFGLPVLRDDASPRGGGPRAMGIGKR